MLISDHRSEKSPREIRTPTRRMVFIVVSSGFGMIPVVHSFD